MGGETSSSEKDTGEGPLHPASPHCNLLRETKFEFNSKERWEVRMEALRGENAPHREDNALNNKITGRLLVVRDISASGQACDTLTNIVLKAGQELNTTIMLKG